MRSSNPDLKAYDVTNGIMAYFDYASTAPMRPSVKEAIKEVLEEQCLGDPSRIHDAAVVARSYLEQARAGLAALLQASTRRVLFTSSATEAIAHALYSVCSSSPAGSVLVSAVEYSSLLDAASQFSKIFGHRLVTVPVDREARVDTEALSQVLKKERRPVVVAIQACNHEIGTVQPLTEVASLVKGREVPWLLDAAASFGYLPLPLELKPDFTCISGHKIGGPPGVGALVLAEGVQLKPFIPGHQERGRRGGLENVLGAVGFAAAATEAIENLERERERLLFLREKVERALQAIEGVTIWGAPDRAPHITSFSAQALEAQGIVMQLNTLGIYVHSGSACAAEDLKPSHVLQAIGADTSQAVRISMGYGTTEEEVEELVAALPQVIEELRSLAAS